MEGNVVQADQLERQIMMTEPAPSESPHDVATRDFLFGQVWSRPGLSVRDRRLVTLACVGAAGPAPVINAHLYAALRSGDFTLDQLQEFTLHFAVYCGWPKASQVEASLREQWKRMHDERGESAPAWPQRPNDDWIQADPAELFEQAKQSFADINLIALDAPDSVYCHVGVLNFVFGHVWQRPGLTRRERRLISLACAGTSDSTGAIWAHVNGALGSGDISYPEMQEIVLQFSAYAGFAKGQALSKLAERVAAQPARRQ